MPLLRRQRAAAGGKNPRLLMPADFWMSHTDRDSLDTVWNTFDTGLLRVILVAHAILTARPNLLISGPAHRDSI